MTGFVQQCYGDLTAISRGNGPRLLAVVPGTVLALIAPPALAAAVLGTLAGGAQAGFRVYPKMLELKFDRLNPLPKLKQLLKPQHAGFELLLAVLRVGIVGWVCYQSLEKDLPTLLGLTGSPVAVSIGVTASVLLSMILKAIAVLLVMAAVDYAQSRHKLEKEMRMATKDIKEELKQYEQDPALKGKLRQRMREVNHQRIIAAVSEADVVVTNPTHIAVAIRYADTDVAPTVVSKGHDQLALRIRAEARKHGISIIENRPLARALDAEAELGAPIGVEHYVAVAEVLAFVFRLRGGSRGARARSAQQPN